MDGKALQLVSVIDGKLHLVKETYDQVFDERNISDRKISVISIVGRNQTGKSFLLNYFLQFLSNQHEEEWLHDIDPHKNKFEFGNSSEPLTKGIHIWSRPFTYINSQKEEILVFLVDTEGIFSNESKDKSDALIFGLTLLISSLVIFNVKNNIDRDFFEYLRAFSKYAKLAGPRHEFDRLFQKMQVLVRDWEFMDFEYGFAGGNKLLTKRLSENTEIKKIIEENWMSIDCFLLPRIGDKARNKEFFGLKSDLKREFIEQLQIFITGLFIKQEFCVNKTENQDFIVGDWLICLLENIENLNNKQFQNVEDILKQQQNNELESKVNDIIAEYDKNLIELVETCFCLKEALKISTNLLNNYLQKFNAFASQYDSKLVLNKQKKMSVDLNEKNERFLNVIFLNLSLNFLHKLDLTFQDHEKQKQIIEFIRENKRNLDESNKQNNMKVNLDFKETFQKHFTDLPENISKIKTELSNIEKTLEARNSELQDNWNKRERIGSETFEKIKHKFKSNLIPIGGSVASVGMAGAILTIYKTRGIGRLSLFVSAIIFGFGIKLTLDYKKHSENGKNQFHDSPPVCSKIQQEIIHLEDEKQKLEKELIFFENESENNCSIFIELVN